MNKLAAKLILVLLVMMLSSCRQHTKQYVIGVSQCSNDVWRDKLNRELRTSSYVHGSIQLEIESANDNDEKQINQINHFINEKVDMLVVSPNQYKTITPVIEKAYNKGIPVILFDRKSNSNKYTGYIGVDNYEVGHVMGTFIAAQLKGRGLVVEISGLAGSSPAQARHKGFMDVLKKYPEMGLVASASGDWTEKSGYQAMSKIIREYKGQPVDFIFVHNDRMANGVIKAIADAKSSLFSHSRLTGVDAISLPDGGLRMVMDGKLAATYIYPTNGNAVISLALKILQKKPFKRDNLFRSTIVTRDNAALLLQQTQEIERQSDNLQVLHEQGNRYLESLNMQRAGLLMTIVIIVLLAIVIFLGYRAFASRAKINAEHEKMKDIQLKFFTNVSHQIRTPLTLIADPIDRIASHGKFEDGDMKTLQAVDRNAKQLMTLVNNILDFKDVKFDEAGNRIAGEDGISDTRVPEVIDEELEKNIEEYSDSMTSILIVDDNKDIRDYVRSILISDYKVWVAADGEEGLNMARIKEPDLIISDIMMPKMDGLEMTRAVKSDVAISHIPVLLLTAKSEEEQIVSGFESGAIAYLTKPFSSKILLARIKRIIQEQERMRRQIAAEMQYHMDSNPVEDSTALSFGKNITIKDKVFLEKLHAVLDKEMEDSELSVERIGMNIGLSRVQLYRKVKAMTGMSPVELLRKVRLNRARILLQTTDKTVSEVAYEVGFSAPSYFSKCYKDEFNELPTDGRK
jgi:ABC-type sugar transport system substrate-binding protein/DNA-binding response OmpR family regulator